MVKVRGANEEELRAARAKDIHESRLVSEVLKQDGNVFGEPTQLPLLKVYLIITYHYWRAPLQPIPDLIDIPLYKKNVIEKVVQEMLAQGIIQHSSSLYASPVVLVENLMEN